MSDSSRGGREGNFHPEDQEEDPGQRRPERRKASATNEEANLPPKVRNLLEKSREGTQGI